MPEIIAVVNQKGGVGKTTTAINIGACLAAAGKKTLLIDADSQGNSTSGLGIVKKTLSKCIYHTLIDDEPLKNITLETPMPGLFIAPANLDLLGINQELNDIENGQLRLKEVLDSQLIDDDGRKIYDFVIIDAPPNLDMMLINIMAASTKILIPTLPEWLALEGLADLVDTYSRIRETLNKKISILGILITKYVSTNKLSREVANELRENMPGLVFDNVIPQNVRLAEAPGYCKPIIMYDPRSTGAVSYQAVTDEILARVGK
ncbi:ParA family protein [Deltaproteobacteria bacterium OttesenSCG-928-K17]|nr:ParA family protein [Deltaproteobacteria bacterium OttesenSCG-928-K17]